MHRLKAVLQEEVFAFGVYSSSPNHWIQPRPSDFETKIWLGDFQEPRAAHKLFAVTVNDDKRKLAAVVSVL